MDVTQKKVHRSIVEALSLALAFLFLAYFALGSGLNPDNIAIRTPNVSSIYNWHANVSGNITLNISIFISFPGFLNGSNVTNLTVFFYNRSGISVFNLTNNSGMNITFNETGQRIGFSVQGFATGDFLPDGNYTLNISIYNGTYAATESGFASNASSSLTVDNTAPNVTIWANVSNGTNLSLGSFEIGATAKIEINVSANDSTTYVQSVKVGIQNATSEINLTAFRNFSYYVAVLVVNQSLADDVYALFAYVNDSVNNFNSSGNTSFRLDRIAPSFNLFAGPVNLTNTSNSTVPFRFNMTDNLTVAQVNCSLFYNTTLIAQNLTTFNGTASNISGAAADGIYRAYVSCGDYSGNRGNTSDLRSNLPDFTFAIDTTVPRVTAFWGNYSPTVANYFNLTNAKLELNAIANDSFYVQMVEFGINTSSNDSDSFFLAPATRNGSIFVGVLDTALLIDGIYNAYVSANDSVGNANRSFVNITFGVDRVAPNVTQFLLNDSYGVLNASNFTGGVVAFNLTVNDSTLSVETVKVGVTGGVLANETNYTLAKNFSGYHAAVNLNSILSDGFYTLRVYANDTINNLNNSLANLSFRLDRTPPNATQFLLNDSYGVLNASNFTGGVVAFNLTVNDSTLSVQTVKVGVTGGILANETNYTLAKNFSGYHAAVNLNSILSDGFYTLRVYANDTINNLNNSLANLSFRLDRTPPNVTAGLNYTNFINLTNAKIEINVSSNDSTTYTQAVIVTFNTTNGTGFNVTASRNASGFVSVIDTALMAEGIYTAVIIANDSVANHNRSTVNLTFGVDRTAPNLSAETFVLGNFSGYAGHDARYVGINLSAGLSEGNYTLMVMVNDTTTHPQMVRFNLSNSSGAVLPFNYTAVKNGTNYSAFTFNVSRLAEGWYNLTVWTNDSVDNINDSLRLTVVVDRTAPAVTAECSPAAASAGETVTCTCTAADSYPGSGLVSGAFPGGGSSESTTAAGSGGTSSTCRGVDYAGNVRTATASWSVSAAGGGGGGGGSGGSGGRAAGETVIAECIQDSDCGNEEFCSQNRCLKIECTADDECTENEFCVERLCVTLFDMMIPQVDFSLAPGEPLSLQYLTKNMGSLAGDAVLSFLLENEEQAITLGTDTFFTAPGDETIRQAALYVPAAVAAGAYTLKVTLTFGDYVVSSSRVIEIISPSAPGELAGERTAWFGQAVGALKKANYTWWLALVTVAVAAGAVSFHFRSSRATLQQLEEWALAATSTGNTPEELHTLMSEQQWSGLEMATVLERVRLRQELQAQYGVSDSRFEELRKFITHAARKKKPPEEMVKTLLRCGWEKGLVERLVGVYVVKVGGR